MKNGKMNGNYIGFIYLDTSNKKPSYKITEQYLDDKIVGLKQLIRLKEKGVDTIEYHTYVDDALNGKFKEIHRDSIIYGNYKDGKLDGRYKVYSNLNFLLGGNNNGDSSNSALIVDGKYKDGLKQGIWKYYSLTKQLSTEGQYSDDLKCGEWKYYFESYVEENGERLPYSGKLFKIENYYNGFKNGKTNRYAFLEEKIVPCDSIKFRKVNISDTCRKLVFHKIDEIENYKNDILNGLYELKDSVGNIVSKGVYKDNKKEGNWIEGFLKEDNFSNGNPFYVYYKGDYTNDLETGIWIRYINENSVAGTYLYLNGKLNGRSTEFNNLHKPIEEKYYDNGRLIKLDAYDSLGEKIIRSYDLYDEDFYLLKCKKTDFYSDSIESQIYDIKKEKGEPINPNNFDLFFLINISDLSDGTICFANGEYKLKDNKGNILIEGNVYKKMKRGIWRFNFSDLNLYKLEEYIDNNSTSEKYFELSTNKSFSGKFLQKYKNGKTKFEFKIVNGLRDGKSKYYNENGDETKVEKYEKGIIKL